VPSASTSVPVAPVAPVAFPLEIAISVPLATWKALFDARGYPPALTAARFAKVNLAAAAVADALGSPDLPLPLRRALHVLLAFATEAARVDIYSAAEALGYPAPFRDAVSPADLAALLLAASANDAAAREILEVAQVLRDRSFRPLTTQIYVGAPQRDAELGEPASYEEAWRRELTAWCARRGFGAVVRVRSQARGDVLVVEVVHEDRVVTHATATASPDFALVSHRPLRSHALLYGATSRRLSITTDCLEAMTPLASIAGRVFFGDPRHFLDEPAVDLWKLQELGAAALSVPALADKLTASAIGGTWRSGKKHDVTTRGRGRDLFDALERYKIRIEGGELDLVTLRAKVHASDGGPDQCDVALRPPHLLTVSEPELAPLLHEFLDRALITSPEPRKRDFFSRQPWIDTRAEWVRDEGEAGFAALVAQGLLRADPTNRAVTPPAHPHAGRTARAYPLRSGKLIAWSPDPTIAPFVVRDEDLVVYALSFERLAATVAGALGLEGEATALDDDGVLFCGRRALGPTHVHLFLLTRRIRPATVERLREAAGHGHAILITPERRMKKHGLRQVATPKLAGSWRPLLGEVIRALKLEPLVDTTLYAPEGARIVLHRATQRVWIDGVPCAKVTEMSFKLLAFLVAQGTASVHTRDIALHLRGGHWHDDTTRKAIDALYGAIEASFKALKKEPPRDLRALLAKPKHGQYALTVLAFAD
jgi:hypothetical protein